MLISLYLLEGQLLSNGISVSVNYNGEWRDGKRSGKGCLTTSSPSEYNGDWVHGRRHGSGKQTYPSGNVYEGQWKEDMKSGLGIYQWLDQNQVIKRFTLVCRFLNDASQIYEGEWQLDRPNGFGCYVWLRPYPGSNFIDQV